MPSMVAFLRKRPALSYYVLALVISYGTLVVLLTTRGLPVTHEQTQAMLQVAIPFFLLGPSVLGLLITVVTDGRSGLRDLGARLRVWLGGADWYASALFLAPALILGVLMTLSVFSPAFMPGVFTVKDKVPRLTMNLTAAVVTGICEEVRWTGFLTPRLRRR